VVFTTTCTHSCDTKRFQPVLVRSLVEFMFRSAPRRLAGNLFELAAAVAAAAASVAPSFPHPHTGAISCALPIRELVCIVDTRTGFVAGMEYGPGPGYGRRSECSRGLNGTG
jgi:hypothetical protein